MPSPRRVHAAVLRSIASAISARALSSEQLRAAEAAVCFAAAELERLAAEEELAAEATLDGAELEELRRILAKGRADRGGGG